MNKDAKVLLDFDKPQPDPAVFGRIITCMYTGTELEKRFATEIYKKFRSKQYAWDRIDRILLSSESEQVKCCALEVLEDMVKTTWPEYNKQVHTKIQKFMVGIILEKVSDTSAFRTEKVLIDKLNRVLVEILKWEWPHNYPNIIPEMMSGSLHDTRCCENNMNILRILGEEIFERSSDQMAADKAKILKGAFRRNFHIMFKPCVLVLKTSTIEPLVRTALNTVTHFMRWMPATYFFKNDLASVLINKHLNYARFQILTLKCLTEIVRSPNTENKRELVALFRCSAEKLRKCYRFPEELGKSGDFTKQEMHRNVAMFLCTFLKVHGLLIEKFERNNSLLFAMEVLLKITAQKDVEALETCLEYWNSLVIDLNKPESSKIPRIRPYLPVLAKLRSTIIECMTKPEEVLIFEAKRQILLGSEIGNPEVLVVEDELQKIGELVINTDSVQIYKDMKKLLVYLTHMDYAQTERIMRGRLRNIVIGTESFKNLDTLCWAIGSISGTMPEEQEELFLVEVLDKLLELFALKQSNDDKAKISMNIMYVVGEYPRLLKTYWIFLKAVVERLLAFMEIPQPGVQNMACCMFLKIAQNCPKKFLQIQVGEEKPFIEYILTKMKKIIPLLQPQQAHTFYEAVGSIIVEVTDKMVRDSLIEEYMSLSNDVWDPMVKKLNAKEELELNAILQLEGILKINIQACMALGHSYTVQLTRIYDGLLSIYKMMSENITGRIRKNRETAMNQPKAVAMRNVRKEILKLVSEWIKRSTDSQMVGGKFIPSLLDSILLDYQQSIPLAREPEVLSTMTNIVNRLKSHIAPAIPKVSECVLECTFNMIKNSMDFPEHQRNFLLLLHAAVTHCFSALLKMDSAEYRLVWNSIIWAFEHTKENVVDAGLKILHRFLQNMEAEVDTSQSFYKKYYADLLERLFVTVMQMPHSADLTMQATLLAYLFGLVKSGKITVYLEGKQENMAYIQKYVTDLLSNYDTRLTESEIPFVVQRFFNLHQDVLGFKEHLRNFLKNCIQEGEQKS